MFVLILQSALLLAIAFILGCILGCLLRTLFADDAAPATGGAAVAGAGAGAGASAATAAAGLAAAGAATTARTATPPAPAVPTRTTPSVPAKKPAAPKAPEPVGLMQPAASKTESAPVAKAAPKPKPKAAAKPKPKAPAKPKAAVKPKAVSKPKPAAKPRPAAAKKPSGPPAAGAKADDLKLIRGIGRQNEARLNAFGVSEFQHIADWTSDDASTWGERLAFPGRIEREDWIGQAKVLASGGSTPFASRVRRGGVSTSTGKGTVGDLGKQPKLLGKPRASGPDNLTLIDGVGNALEKRLFGIGIYHFDQIAAFSDAEAKWVGIAVGFPGRVERENWIGESKTLAAGGMTDHARRVEEGKISTSRVSTGDEKKDRDD